MQNTRQTQASIERNPFAIIGATTRDDRKKILELAEEKSFSSDPDLCTKARSDLTNPRNRLTAEVSWLPCVSPKRTNELLNILKSESGELLRQLEIEPLARANLMASAMEALNESLSVAEWTRWILAFADTFDQINHEKVLRHVNEDRVVSGFPEITNIELISKELTERRHVYNESIKQALNRLPSEKLLEIVTTVVDTSTKSGTKHAATLVDDIVDKYQIETQGQLQAGAEKILQLIEGAKQAAANGEIVIIPIIEAIEKSVRSWDRVAQPIQLNFKSRGLDHDASLELGSAIRNLAIDITNEHGMLEATTRLTDLLKEVFAELPEFAARLDEDTAALENLFKQRDEEKEDQEKWQKDITYEADIGVVFKEKLRISPDGIQWKNRSYPLNKITEVRWGAIRHSVNGIPTGTTYTIAFGDDSTEAVVELRRKEVYAVFLDKLWKAVCVRLMVSMLKSLRSGEKLNFGGVLVDDRGIELKRAKFLSSEHAYFTWDKVRTWSAGGSYIIGSQEDKRFQAEISYINVHNAHILEACVSAAFKKWRGKISGILD